MSRSVTRPTIENTVPASCMLVSSRSGTWLGRARAWRAFHDRRHGLVPPFRRVRLHEEFKRRIKTQTVLPSADTAAMLFWALLASGQIVMRKIDGWNTLSTVSSDQQQLDAAA